MYQASLVSDLKRLIQGEVSDAPPDLAGVSFDFGRLVQKVPRVVVRPRDVHEVARVVAFAYQRDMAITPHAGGNSFGGQSLSDGGICLDLRQLRALGPIRPEAGWFEADAGVRWFEVVEATLALGVIPPVLPSYLRTTVGGTHSAAGFGAASFCRGAQIDHCLELEVVLYSGEVVRCNLDENPELFQRVLGGYGQFGVITRVRHRLRRFLPHSRTYFLLYDDLPSLLSDQARLVAEGRVDAIDASIQSCYVGHRQQGGRPAPLHVHLYPMTVTVEADELRDAEDQRVLKGLNFHRWVYSEDLRTAEHTLIGRTEERLASAKVAHIFTDVFVPWSSLERFVLATQRHVLPNIVNVEHLLLWPIQRAVVTRPMVQLPEEAMLMGIGLYCRVPQANAAATLAVAQGFVDLAMQMGGRYYLAGSVRFDAARLKAHFGDAWPGVVEAKQRFDPKGLLNPGFFPAPP